MPDRLRIVVADDSPVIRDLIREILMFEDGLILIEEFADGRDAVRWVSGGHTADIFIVDMRLPGLSGAATIRAVRQHLEETRIIAFSASAQEHSVEAAMAAGANSYLLKDSTLAELIEAIRGKDSVPEPARLRLINPDTAASADQPIPSADPKALRVAVVDDHDLVREATRLLLETDPDISVVDFANGADVIAWAQDEGSADVALVDMRLGDVRGEEVLRQLRQLHPEMTLIIHSGSSQAEFGVEPARLGADMYLVKGTCSASELVQHVREAAADKVAG